MYRDLVTVAVEHALITIEGPGINDVESRLQKDYGITLGDSLDHPEYLKTVLRDSFGISYPNVLNTIYVVIDNVKEEKIVKDFLNAMEE